MTEHPYLGFTIFAAPDPRRRYRSQLILDSAAVTKLTAPLYSIFSCSSRHLRLAPKAIIRGIHQVIHFKFLYPTTLQDTSYDIIDVQVYRCLRRLFGVPHCSPTALLAADLGIWPSIYYAHQRALNFLWHLRHDFWTKPIFDEWMPSVDADPPMVKMCSSQRAIIPRFHIIMQRYGLRWFDLNTTEKF